MLGGARWVKVGLLSLMGFAILSVVAACADTKKLHTVELTFVQDGAPLFPTVHVEVCATPQERSLGLMYRKTLGKDAGMLFVFPSERMNTFWMKNTYLSLDMVFVDSKMKVVGVLENVPPLNEEPRGVGIPSQYVVELAGGMARKYGVRNGVEVKIIGDLPVVR